MQRIKPVKPIFTVPSSFLAPAFGENRKQKKGQSKNHHPLIIFCPNRGADLIKRQANQIMKQVFDSFPQCRKSADNIQKINCFRNRDRKRNPTAHSADNAKQKSADLPKKKSDNRMFYPLFQTVLVKTKHNQNLKQKNGTKKIPLKSGQALHQRHSDSCPI